MRAVFLDRDGVINVPVVREGKPYPPDSLEDFQLYSDVQEACQALKNAGFLLIVATNQPDVGRGTQKREVVEAIHAKICECLPIDHIEVCYDPGQGQASEFHKPAPGMLLRAAGMFGLDLAWSYMIGDRWRDIDCGYAAGCRTIFIQRGYSEKLNKSPHFTVCSLNEAVAIILKLEVNSSK